MGTRAVVETRRDRKALIADAGYKPLSIVSVLAGVMTAYGAFAVLAGIGVGIIQAADVDIDLASNWDDLGVAGGLVVAGLLLLTYLFGGYVAGRMARRSGMLHGVVVFVVGVVLAAGAAFLARQLGGADVATDNLRGLGLPTTADEWREVATVAGIASLAAMLVGALLGGALGERWHDKLLRRALDPELGAEAQARRDAERRAAEAEELRIASFRRVRATTPTRTRRVDGDADGTVDTKGDAVTNDDGKIDRDDDWVTPAPAPGAAPVAAPVAAGPVPPARAWSDRPDKSDGTGSFWWRRRSRESVGDVDGDRDRHDVDLTKHRPKARSSR
ncbi:MAG: hypothetical protein ACRD2W_21760 [Acidimicrobiales bacterium]